MFLVDDNITSFILLSFNTNLILLKKAMKLTFSTAEPAHQNFFFFYAF